MAPNVRMGMKDLIKTRQILVFSFVMMIASSCGGGSNPVDGDTPLADDGPILAAAVKQLISVDHTFGSGPPPFTEYLLQANTDPTAGIGGGITSRPLTAIEREAIEAAVAEFGPMQWIGDPDEWRTDDLSPTVEGSAIVGVGEPRVEGSEALVPVSLWCGGVCGTWLTYRVEKIDGTWSATGIEGPIAIS